MPPSIKTSHFDKSTSMILARHLRHFRCGQPNRFIFWQYV